jgi:hypothetical protein
MLILLLRSSPLPLKMQEKLVLLLISKNNYNDCIYDNVGSIIRVIGICIPVSVNNDLLFSS